LISAGLFLWVNIGQMKVQERLHANLALPNNDGVDGWGLRIDPTDHIHTETI
jgi:hypothetical protein